MTNEQQAALDAFIALCPNREAREAGAVALLSYVAPGAAHADPGSYFEVLGFMLAPTESGYSRLGACVEEEIANPVGDAIPADKAEAARAGVAALEAAAGDFMVAMQG